jgi:hypothetical protein
VTRPGVSFCARCRRTLASSFLCLSMLHGKHSQSAKSTTNRINAIFQMLKRKTVVCGINLAIAFNEVVVYRNSILSRLEMNHTCFEVQRQAVKRPDISIRPQLLTGVVCGQIQSEPSLLSSLGEHPQRLFERIRRRKRARRILPCHPLLNDILL